MQTGTIVAIVVIVILIAIIVALYFLGKKAQKKQAEQQEQIDAYKQIVTMLLIDKKKLRLTESCLTQSVIESTPKLMRRSKLPIVKAKVGPQIVTLVADEKIYDEIPVKKEVKAVVSGIYITSVRGLHGKTAPVEQKKKSRFKQALERAQEKAGVKQVK